MAAWDAKLAGRSANSAVVEAEVCESRVLQFDTIKTPYGNAQQSNSLAALKARETVENGANLYRIGTTGKSQAAEAQFWALEHPLTPGFSERYGIPIENIANYDFIECATLKPGSLFITRMASGVGGNSGGAIEVVVSESGVKMSSFSYVGKR
ncbi:MAG: hypothetical protein HEEMFOPI_02055 [Holosporales bacterium]